jgi:periplasmic copper chaperone A
MAVVASACPVIPSAARNLHLIAFAALLLACGAAERTWRSSNGEIAVLRVVAPAPVSVGSPAEATMAVYATIVNRGAVADTLTGVESPLARVAGVHATMDHGGSKMMMPTQAVLIPAGEVVRLAPGGTHAMLEQLTRLAAPGDSVPVTLVFRRAGPVPVRATVVRYDQMERILRP